MNDRLGRTSALGALPPTGLGEQPVSSAQVLEARLLLELSLDRATVNAQVMLGLELSSLGVTKLIRQLDVLARRGWFSLSRERDCARSLHASAVSALGGGGRVRRTAFESDVEVLQRRTDSVSSVLRQQLGRSAHLQEHVRLAADVGVRLAEVGILGMRGLECCLRLGQILDELSGRKVRLTAQRGESKHTGAPCSPRP